METNELVAELEKHAARLEDELSRIRSAIDALRGTTTAAHSARPSVRRAATHSKQSAPKGETMRLIGSTLATHGPMGYRELAETMLAEGWKTASDVPANSVRTALSRMLAREQLTKLDDGRYAPPGWTEETLSHEQQVIG